MIRYGFRFGLALLVVVMFVLAACAPTASPAPAPATPATQAPASAPTVAPKAATVDAGWQKVIEAAKREGVVTLYSFGWTGDIGISIAKAFQENYGIKVEIITGRGAEFIERLKTEKRSGKMVADLFEGGTPHAVNIKLAGLTVSSKDVPALKDLGVFVDSPFIPDPDGHVLAYNVYLYSPYINTNLIKPGEEPKVWKDLLDPKWKGRMMFGSPKVSMVVYMQFWPLKAAGVVDMDYLRALGKQDLLWTTGTAEDTRKLSTGERDMSIFGTPVTMGQAIADGAPIKAIPMEPAMAAANISLASIKDGPHPNATKLLINWMMTSEGQLAHNKPRKTSSLIKGGPSFLPKAADVKAPRIIGTTPELLEEEARDFNGKVMVKEWGLE